MLSRDVRRMVFISSFILLVVALYRLKVQTVQTKEPQLGTGFNNVHVGVSNEPKEPIRNLMSMEHKERIYQDSVPKWREHLLDEYVVQGVKQFVFFVGYARSGHSIFASILDAHPHIVISHEYSLFSKWGSEPVQHCDKRWLFSVLYNNSKASAEKGHRWQQAQKKGYTLAIPRWWQGKYDSTITVIGDKSGGMTAQAYRRSKQTFKSVYQELKSTVEVPIKVVHIIRNPYDNIATMLLYNTHHKNKVNATYILDDVEKLRAQIASYFHQVRNVVEMIKDIHLNVIEIHNVDVIANPKGVLRDVCAKLFVKCSDEYLHMSAETLFVSESKTRHLVNWTPQLIDLVQSEIQNYKHLHRYSFTL